jgi:hypothetical protein
MDSFSPHYKGPQSLAKTEIPHRYPGWSQTRHLLCPRHNLWGLEPIVAGGALPLLENKMPDLLVYYHRTQVSSFNAQNISNEA